MSTALLWAVGSHAQVEDSRWKHLEVSPQQDFIAALQAVSQPLSEWIRNLNQSPMDFVCLGERHEPVLREELAKQVFSTLKMDVLFLEAVPDKTQDLVRETRRANLAKEFQAIHLLSAPIGVLISQALQSNPELRIVGVEQTPDQKRELNLMTAQGNRTLSRDSYIARNILEEMKGGQRHVALYGASHCAKINVDSGWMKPFFPMLGQSQPEKKMRSVKVVVMPENGQPQPDTPEGLLLIYLSSSGMTGSSFVITDTSKLSPEVFNSKDVFLGLFSAYDAILYLKRSQ